MVAVSDNSDNTPPRTHRSGEWSEMDELRGTCYRIEKKLDAVIKARGEDERQAVRIDERLKTVEAWIAEKKQFGIGAWLSVIGAVASPVAVIVFECLRHP